MSDLYLSVEELQEALSLSEELAIMLDRGEILIEHWVNKLL